MLLVILLFECTSNILPATSTKLFAVIDVHIVVATVAALSVVASICESAAKSRRITDVIRSGSNSCRRHHCVSVVVCTRSTTPSRRNASYATAYHQTSTSVPSAAAASNYLSAVVRRSPSNTTPTPVAYWTQSAIVSVMAALTCTRRLDLGSAAIKHLTFWLTTSASIISTGRWPSTGPQNLRAGVFTLTSFHILYEMHC